MDADNVNNKINFNKIKKLFKRKKNGMLCLIKAYFI